MTDYHTRLRRKYNDPDAKTCYTCDLANHNYGMSYFKCAHFLEKRQRSVPDGKCKFWRKKHEALSPAA